MGKGGDIADATGATASTVLGAEEAKHAVGKEYTEGVDFTWDEAEEVPPAARYCQLASDLKW